MYMYLALSLSIHPLSSVCGVGYRTVIGAVTMTNTIHYTSTVCTASTVDMCEYIYMYMHVHVVYCNNSKLYMYFVSCYCKMHVVIDCVCNVCGSTHSYGCVVNGSFARVASRVLLAGICLSLLLRSKHDNHYDS